MSDTRDDNYTDPIFHTAITMVNGTCYISLSDELDLRSAARILEARGIRGRLLVDCRGVVDMTKAELDVLMTLARGGGVLLSHVTRQLHQTLEVGHLDSIVTILRTL